MKNLPTIDELNAELEQPGKLPTIDELNAGIGQPEKLPTIEELNAGLVQQNRLPTIEELNGEAQPTKKDDPGVFARMKLEKEAQLGKEMGTAEAVASYLPVVGGVVTADANRQRYVEQRLMKGEVSDPTEMIKLAQSIGIDQKQIDELVAQADSGQRSIAGFKMGLNADVLKNGFSVIAKERFANRLKTQQEKQQQLEAAEDLGILGEIAKGTLGAAGAIVEYANPITTWGTLGMEAVNRGAELQNGQWQLDENGNPVQVKAGDGSAASLAKGLAGATAEKAIWTGIAGRIAKIGGGKLLEKIPELNKVAGLAAKGVTGATEKVAAWMAKSDGGRLALKTMETIGKIDEKLHFGSLPNMIFKTRLTELADNVVGLNKPAGERESFGQWLENFVSVENNAELLTGIIGIHLLTAGFGAAKAYRANKEFRHGGGQKGQDYGREELVAEYIGAERAKKLSNQDLENIYELITSPDLTVEKATEFVDKLEADRAKAQEKIDAGESLENVLDGVAEKRAASTRAEEAARLVGEKLQKRAEISPEQHEVLDAKIAEYAGGQEAIVKLVKADIEKNLKDTAAIDNPDMLEELVAMSTRKFNGEARRLKIHDLRGNQDVGAQMQGIEELGVSSWDEAEAQGLVTKDKYGRYGGGARRALNISLHGTDKLKEAVRDGRIDGALAEDLLTAAQCELGNRPPEEQAALVDGVLDRANGDAALARRMLEKLTADRASGGPEPLPKDWKSFSERMDRIAEEAKTEAIRERNPTLSEEEARGAAVEPVETADGKITTVGETVDADGGITSVRQQGAEPKPMTALDGAENADRLAGTKLTVFNGATMSCNRFPEAKVRVSSYGVIVNGLTADALAKPENMADVAAFLTHVSRIAQKNGLKIIFDDAGAANIAKSVLTEIREQGAEKTMNKLNLRSKLFGLLFKTTLGNGVTYDEASFKTALEKTSNGRQFVNSYGDVYGLVDSEGIIHFNPTALHMDTPIHEYGHLALEATKKINNALWKRGNELVKESQYYRDLLAEIKQDPNSPYRNMNEEWLCDEALARLIGDRGAKLVESKGVEAQLKEWLKSVWKAFKGAFGVADLTEEQIEKMSLGEFVDTMNAELLKGGEFGTKKAQPLEKRSIKRFDEDQNSGSNGLLRWKNDRGYLFAIPVDMEQTQPGGRVVLATDNANVTDWIQNALNGVELRMSRTRKLYVKGRDGLDGELAEIFGRYPTIGMNDGIFEQIASETGRPAGTTPEALVEALRKDRESYNSWTRDRNAEAEHWENEQAREEAEAQQRWEQSGMSVVDYVKSRAEEGDPAFDLDWETAREIERDRAAGRFNIGNRDKDGAELNKKPRLKPDLSKRENSVAFKKFVREIPAAPLPERLHDSKPKTVFEWYMNNMVGKTYSFDIPGYGHREFKPNPGHIGKLVCSGGTNSDGTPIVKGRIKNINGKDWQSLVREGKISESDVEGWDPIRARSITLIPEILESFDFVLHEKDRHDRDVLIFAKKFTNKRGRPNTIVMRLIDDGNTIGPVSTHMKDLTETWLKNKDLVTTSGNEVYSRGKDNSASQTPLPAANAEGYSTGIDSTIPKSDQNGNGLSKMSVGRLYTGSTADYAGRVDFNPSMIVYNPNLKAMGDLEQNAGGLAAAIEKKEALRPWTKKGSPCDLAKPIAFDSADMVMLWRAVSGSVRNPIIRKGERIPGRKNAVGLNRGGTQIELASKLFGVIDEGDVTKLKADCKADGFFRHENPDWCATQPKVEVDREVDRSQAEIDRRTRELYARRVRTGEGGEHYATQVLGHEIGHTIASLPADANLGPVGNAARTLFDAMARELRRASDPLRQKKGEKDLMAEQTELIKWWHGTDRMPDYYKKPQERFAEVFGIFLTQPESVQSMAPKTYDTLVDLMGKNERLALAYQKINKLKWSGKSNDRVMKQVQATWTKEAQEQYRRLVEESKKAVSLNRDWFNWALNDRFGPMFAIAKRSLAAERKHLDEAVREGAMSKQEAADRIKAKEDEINELKTTLYNWQRQSGGQTRLMIAGFDEVMYNAEKDGVNWNDVREYAHLMRVIELGGRATAHGVDPARAAAILEEKKNKLGVEMFGKIEKSWKAYRAVYERYVLEDANVRELFDDATNKMLWENKHFVTMKHRMSVEETAEWLAKIDAYRKGDPNAWDPCIDVYERMHKGLKGGAEGERGFVLYHLIGSFEATEDPLAATIKRAIEIKESAARNHLLKQMSETLRTVGAKGVYDTAIEKGARRRTPDPAVYGKLTYMDGGVTHELIVPKVIYLGFKADPMSFGKFGAAMRFLRNTMTIWSPSFVNRAYLIDKSSLETNVKGLHKPAIDVLSEALCFRGVGVPIYMVNNYLTRFTPIANTWVGKILWNEHTVNHYAYRAQKIARMVYEGKFGEHLDRAKELRKQGLTAEASEIEQNVAIAKEMLRKNVFQSTYEFNRNQAGLATEDILRGYGYRIDGSKDAKTWHGKVWEKTKAGGRLWNRFEEEQEACTKIIAYLYQMKMDEKAGRTGAAAADARARLVIEQGGTPNLSARGVFASFIENATGFFWNVRKEGFLRTKRALLDHPTEWITKNLAQTALPALVKGLIATGGMEWLVYKLFGDDEEKIKRSWWAPAFLEHCRFVNEAMKCVPGYYQRNYNVIPLAKFGDEVVSLRVKYSPEEFALQNAIHTAFQKLGKDPTDPSADWSTLAGAMWSEFLPNVAGRNYAQEFLGMLVGPFIGYNPYDAYRQRNVYDKMTWDARWDAPGHMVKEIAKNFWNYSPLGTFTTTFKNGEERKIEDSDVPAWLDRVLQTPFVRMIPASMLAVTSRDSYTKALKEVDDRQAAVVRLASRDILAECVERGSLGGFAEGLKDVPQEYRMMAVRYVINGWRMAMMDPRTRQFKQMRSIKDPRLRKWAKEWIEKGMQYQD